MDPPCAPVFSFDKLHCDTEARARFANAAFEHVAHAKKFAPYLFEPSTACF